MGGVDLGNETGAVLEALNAWAPSINLKVTVVMGPNAPWRNEVTQLAKRLLFPTDILVNVQYMGDLMCNADLAIGAAGSSAWERCCLGLPTLQLVLSKNQNSIAQALSKAGAAYSLDRFEVKTKLSVLMDNLRCDPSLLFRMSNAASMIVDGNGADRMAHYLTEGLCL